MKHKPKPTEEKAIIPDRNYITCFIVGFAMGVIITLFVVVLIRGAG